MDGEKCVHEFVDRVDFDFSTVSQHLSGLKAAGVVETDKRGKKVFYRLKCSCDAAFSGASRRKVDPERAESLRWTLRQVITESGTQEGKA